jgi:hypothetical protein
MGLLTMNPKQGGLLFLLLLLSGCATTGPAGNSESKRTDSANCRVDGNGQTEKPETTQTLSLADTASTHVTKETNVTPVTSKSVSPVVNKVEYFTLPQLLYRLDRITTQDSSAKETRMEQMESQLDELSPADRYEFALLLSSKGSSNKLLKRIISILKELETHAKDLIVLEIIRLHRRSFELQKKYNSEHSKTIELNKKIERLKGLEQDLDKSNTRIQESLKPTPGEAQQP